MKRIIIYNSYEYYGGTLVLSALCQTLRKMGYDARLYMIPWFNKNYDKIQYLKILTKHIIVRFINKFFKKHFLGCCAFDRWRHSSDSSIEMSGLAFQWNPFFSKEDVVVIYPECVYGNPLNAKYVVRWLLYHYSFVNNKSAYGKNDLFVAFREIFDSPTLNPSQNIVTINYFDKELYRQYNFEKRKGNCYIIRKGKNRTDLPVTFDGPVFDDNMSQVELVKVFNESAYCYSYDTQTFYTKIAAVCGCIPIVMLEPGKTEQDYLSANEHHLGVAYGNTPEQIEYAIKTRNELLKSLDYTMENIKNATKMLEIMRNRFGDWKR